MANFILDNTASDINTALGKVLSPDTSPTQTDALVTSGGVKTYVDNAISVVSSDTTAIEADVAALQSLSVKQAVFSFPDKTFHSSQSLTGWTLLSDSTGGVTYNANGTFTLGSGLWVGFFSSLAKEINDNDGDKFTFSLRKNGSNIWSRSLDGASHTNPLIVQRSLAGSNSYDFYMYEFPTNTSTSLENTVFVLTKYD